jgi:hypothetical protein
MASTVSTFSTPRQRVSAEYLEMPGLRLTLIQASRLFGLESTQCSALLDALVDEGFLVRHRDGTFARPGHLPDLRSYES